MGGTCGKAESEWRRQRLRNRVHELHILKRNRMMKQTSCDCFKWDKEG
jgi:hypothetical protein